MTEKSQIIKIISVVCAYWVISISMVFANKYLVGTNSDQVNISLFVSWVQCLITVVIGLVISLGVSLFSETSSMSWKAVSHLNWGGVDKWPLIKMAGFFVGMLAFNNLCLKIVGVSFYQVARSTTIIFVVIFSVVILKRSVSATIVFCCLLVAGGFILGIDQEGASQGFSVKGVLFGVSSSVFIALTGIYTKQALSVVNRNEFQLTLITNVLASFMFIPVLFITREVNDVVKSERVFTVHFWVLMMGTGVLGFLISWVSAMQINITSPVTHHISANCKAILQTIIAVVAYGERKSHLWWCSVCLVVAGACWYAIQRYREEEQEKAKQKLLADGSIEKNIIVNIDET